MTQAITIDIALAKVNELTRNKNDEAIQSIVMEFIQSTKKKAWSSQQDNLIEILLKSSIRTRKIYYIKEGLTFIRATTTGNSGKLENFFKILTYILELLEEEVEKLNYKVVDPNLDSEDLEDETEINTLKFISEVYKTLLDFTKVNNKLLELSHKILKSTFDFCKKFQLQTEFKRLSDSVRGYLQTLLKTEKKNYTVPNKVDVNNIDVIKTLIQIRTSLLETSIDLNQWQEALKIAEDIILLLNKVTETKGGKQLIPDRYMFSYFQALTKLFESNKYYLFNSFAFLNLKQYYMKLEKTQQKTGSLTVSKVLTSINYKQIIEDLVLNTILAYNFETKTFIKFQNEILSGINGYSERDLESNERLMSILRMNFFPNKEYIVGYIFSNNLLEICNESLKNLFLAFYKENNNYDLFSFAKNLDLVKNLKIDEQKRNELYLCIRRNLLINLPKSFKSISFARLKKILQINDLFEIDEVILELSNKQLLSVKIDQNKQLLYFKEQINTSLSYYVSVLNVKTTDYSQFDETVQLIRKEEENGLSDTNKRLARMEIEYKAAEQACKDKQYKLEELKSINILAEQEEQSAKEKATSNAKFLEQERKLNKQKDTNLKHYIITKIKSFTNFIFVEEQGIKIKMKISDIERDLEKITSEQLVRAFVDEEENNLKKQSSLYKSITKKVDYKERIKRIIEIEKGKNQMDERNNSIQNELKEIQDRREKTYKIISNKIPLLKEYFSKKLSERQNAFDHFIRGFND